MRIGQQPLPLPDSYLTYNDDGSARSFVGPDAMRFYQASMLGQALRLYASTGMLMTRGATIGMLFKSASKVTGKTYRRGEYLKAAEDLRLWAQTMKAALPVVEG